MISLQSTFKNIKMRCNLGLCVTLLTLGALSTNHNLSAHDSSCESSVALARALLDRYWNDVKNENVKAYSSKIACGFQGLSLSGRIYNRNDQITGFQKIILTAFKIEEITAVRYDESLVISYNFLAEGVAL